MVFFFQRKSYFCFKENFKNIYVCVFFFHFIINNTYLIIRLQMKKKNYTNVNIISFILTHQHPQGCKIYIYIYYLIKKKILLSLFPPTTFFSSHTTTILIFFLLQPMNSKVAYMQPYYSQATNFFRYTNSDGVGFGCLRL